MNTNKKVLYQVKVILENLPEDEYKLIPQETIDYIENNYEIDDSFSINPDIPLENQKISDETFEFLDMIINKIENNKNNGIDEIHVIKETEEIAQLKETIKKLKEENSKISKAKELMQEYKVALKQKDNEIEKLKTNNQDLLSCIQKLPKIIKKIYVKDLNKKLLN